MIPWLTEPVVGDGGEVLPAGTAVTVVSPVPAPPDGDEDPSYAIAYVVHTADERWAFAPARAVAFPDEGPSGPVVLGTVRWAEAAPGQYRDHTARTVALRGAEGLRPGPVWVGDGLFGGPILRAAELRDVVGAPAPELVVTLDVYTPEVGVTAERTVVLGVVPGGLEVWLDVEVGRWPSVGELGVAHLQWSPGGVDVVQTEARTWSECPLPHPPLPDTAVDRCLVRRVERWAWDGARLARVGDARPGPVPVGVNGVPQLAYTFHGAPWDDVVDAFEVEGPDGERRRVPADQVTVDDPELATWAGARHVAPAHRQPGE